MKYVRSAIAWGRQWQQQLPWFLGTALLGQCGVSWLSGPDADDLAAREAEVAQWQARVPQVPTPKAGQGGVEGGGSSGDGTHLAPWPASQQTAAVWTWLQQGAQAQGLQVLAMRPQAMGPAPQGAHALPEQALLLQLQGRWQDWQALNQAWLAQAPWFLPLHWHVVPAGAEAVRIELQARVGLWPAVLQDQRAPQWSAPQWSSWEAAPILAASPFGVPADTGSTAVVAPSSPAPLSADPRHWPVHGLRLQGVWQQSGQWHAVLGAGLMLTTVRVGQQVGQEGYRVRQVGMDGVVLTSSTHSPALHLGWQGDKP